MLNKNAIEKLKYYGFDPDKLIAAVKNQGEIDIELPKAEILTPEQLKDRDTNSFAEGRREGFSEGKTAGVELGGKQLIKKFNLDPTVNHKDLDKVIEAIEMVQKKGDPGLQEQIKLLQTDLERERKEKADIEVRSQALMLDTELISMMPQNRANILSDKEYLEAVKMNLQIVDEDGKKVVKKNGETLRDSSTKNPLPIKQAIDTYFAERKWVHDTKGQGGRGGGNEGGSGGTAGAKSMKAFSEQWVKDHPGVNPIGPEFQSALNKHVKDVPDFDWYDA